MKKRKAVVDQALCASCGACLKVCPKKALSIYKGIYAQVDETLCVGCKKCAAECPASIIEIVNAEVPA